MSDYTRIIVCQGPPLCDHDDAIHPPLREPCPFCKIIHVDEHGEVIASQPGNA